jgi:Protein of unknown function DUF58
MNIAALREKIRRTGYFIPFHFHLLLFILSLFFAAGWLRKNNALPETSRTAIISVFLAVTFWFGLSILILSFISAFVPWLFFLFSAKKNKIVLKIKSFAKEKPNNQQHLQVEISNIIKPLFGYIRLRLLYDGKNISPKFTPAVSDSAKHFFANKIKGFYNWPLQNIKEYDINIGIVYFEDFFQFFSFSTALNAAGNFFTHPPSVATEALNIQPKKTEDTNMRIEEIRKVAGEFLSYKNFENNDDVRRIVWKIYAKNKELVVRIPETNDPYASHIYFYVSFHNSISNDFYEEFNAIFLDNFKTVSWNSYEQLYRQNRLVQYIPDQETKIFYADDAMQRVKYMISTSAWQKQNPLLNYFDKRYGSILCISSLIDAKQLEEILEKVGKGLTIIFVQLRKSFAIVNVVDWLQWIFVKPEKKSKEKLQLAFNLSPLRKKILDNEKVIKEILAKAECDILMIDN